MFQKRDRPRDRPPEVSNGGRGGAVPSIIASDTTILGDLKSRGEVHLDGTVVGDVEADQLVIGESAKLEGAVAADSVHVHGQVVGRVRAREVVLHGTARVVGDVFHETLTVEAGARLEGSCCPIATGDARQLALEGPVG
jgi:cytoskeletal protein CcmA (bactofilin family)